MSSTDASAHGEEQAGWRRRRLLAVTVRAVALVAPMLAAACAAVVCSAWLPAAPTRPWLAARTLLVVAISSLVLLVVDRLARKLLPLATLLQLSLVFPDHAPSRFSLAVASSSKRKMRAVIERARVDGIDQDLGRAATQVLVLASALSDHDRRTRGHSERVRVFADMVGEEMGLTRLERQMLQWAALLHDIGKIAVPPEILNKPGKLTSDEWAVMVEHARVGEAMVVPLRPFLGAWLEGVGGHHEKWDGTGYPRGLVGAAIPRAAAILAVADSFEVMTAARSYKKPLSLAAARAELTKCAGSHFSPEVVRCFLNLSLGRLRLAMGPIAALSHVPLLSSMTQAPAAVTASMGAAVSNAMSVATSVTTAAVMSTALVSTGTVDVAAHAPAPIEAATVLSVEARRVASEPGGHADATLPAAPGAAATSAGGAPPATTTAAPAGTDPTPAGGSPTTTAATGTKAATTTIRRAGTTATTTTTAKAASPAVATTTTVVPTTTAAPTNVLPYLVCVERRSGTWRAYFGYSNDGPTLRLDPGSAANQVSPAPADRGQPRTFRPGGDSTAFDFDWNGSSITWTVNGRIATASSASTPC